MKIYVKLKHKIIYLKIIFDFFIKSKILRRDIHLINYMIKVKYQIFKTSFFYLSNSAPKIHFSITVYILEIMHTLFYKTNTFS
jgi:hypothetical protein